MFYKIVTEPYYDGIGLYSHSSGMQMRWSGDQKKRPAVQCLLTAYNIGICELHIEVLMGRPKEEARPMPA